MKTMIKDFLTIFSTLLVIWTGLISTFIFFLAEASWYVWVPCMLLSIVIIGPAYLFWKGKFSSWLKSDI